MAQVPVWEGELNFIKMHGAGNDYIFIDGFVETLPTQPSDLSIRLSDRRFGIGADGLILMMPAEHDLAGSRSGREKPADVVMKMWNADGSEGAMCGNAARCVAFWMNHTGRISGRCRIQMGPIFMWADVSLVDSAATKADSISLTLPAAEYSEAIVLPESPKAVPCLSLPAASLEQGKVICHKVDCGNPHAVIFVDSLSDELVQLLGPQIEKSAAFQGRTNVEFVRVLERRKLQVRVWERGSGETLACGSGACAAVVAAISEGQCDASVPISVCLPGGTLTVTWPTFDFAGDDVPGFHAAVPDSEFMRLTGPACLEFTGTWLGAMP